VDIQDLAVTLGVRTRPHCGEYVIAGRNGHLYFDGEQLKLCFTDDGRRFPFTSFDKPAALRKLGSGVLRITQEGDYEFVAELDPAFLERALEVLKVKKARKTTLKTKEVRNRRTAA